MSAIQSFIRPDPSVPSPSTNHVALVPHRRRGTSTAWLMLGGYTVATLDMLSAMAYWAPHGVTPEHILQVVVAWLVGPIAFAGGWGTALLGALLYGLLMWGVVALYHALARKWPLLLRRPLLCGGIYGALAYPAIFRILVPLLTGNHSLPALPWMATCVIVYITLVGMPCALFARAAARTNN